MPRAACLLALLLSWPGAASAQDAAGGDFVLRGTQAPGGAAGDAAGPVSTASLPTPRPIGPAMAGPEAPPRQPPPRRAPMPRDDDDDSFAAPGIALGSFVLRPAVEIGVQASDNVHLSRPKRSAVGWVVAPDIDLRSDWQRHEVAFALRGTALFYDDDSLNELDGEARLSGRYDATARTAFDAAVGGFRGTEDFTDPDLPAGAAERPAFRGLEAELGASHRLGRIGLRLSGRAERVEYEDVALVGGGTAGLDDRDYTGTSVRLRTSYRVSPALEPFVEAAAGRVERERPVDGGGFRRSSAWRELTGGLVFDFGPKLSGEVAGGYRSEAFDDPRLERLEGPVANAAVLWSPRRLTNVRLELATNASGSTLDGVAGSLTHSGLVAVERRLRDDLTAEAGFFFARERFVGLDRTDETLGGYAELTYDLNRNLALVGRYAHERLDSSASAADEAENVVSLRVRLKR